MLQAVIHKHCGGPAFYSLWLHDTVPDEFPAESVRLYDGTQPREGDMIRCGFCHQFVSSPDQLEMTPTSTAAEWNQVRPMEFKR